MEVVEGNHPLSACDDNACVTVVTSGVSIEPATHTLPGLVTCPLLLLLLLLKEMLLVGSDVFCSCADFVVCICQRYGKARL